jgi:hypothetical protein
VLGRERGRGEEGSVFLGFMQFVRHIHAIWMRLARGPQAASPLSTSYLAIRGASVLFLVMIKTNEISTRKIEP